MDISKQYDKACEAVDRGNDEYAIQLFQDILSIRPDHLESRQRLRDTVKKKFMKAGVKSAGSAAYIKGLAPLVKMLLFNALKKHDQAIVEAEKFLVHDPNNRLVLTTLGRAAHTNGYHTTAIWTMETLLEDNPADAKSMRLLGEIYESGEEIVKAIECYEKLHRIKPDDRVIEQKLRDLAARRTIQAGWENVSGEKGDFRKVVKNADKADDRAGEEEVIRTSDDLDRNIKRVMSDIEADPTNTKYVIQLGDLYRRGERYQEAEEQYLKAKKLDPKNFAIDERLGDMKIDIYDRQIEELRSVIKKGTAEPGDDAKLKALTNERNEFAAKDYRARVGIRPTDLPLRYNLGVLLFNGGDIDGALGEFQQAIKSPQHRRKATTYCGMCLFRKNMYDMAVQMFEEALQGSVTVERDEKNILYNLGLAAEKLGDLKKAEDAYKKIFNSDMNFRDVKDKIEAIYKLRAAQEAGKNLEA